MNQNLERVENRLNELEAAKADKKARYNKEVEKAQTEKAHLEVELASRDITPDDYSNKLKELNNISNHLDFLYSRKPNEKGKVFTDEEYKELLNALKESMDDVITEYAAPICKAATVFIKLCRDYRTEEEKIESLITRVKRAQGIIVLSSNLGASVTDVNPDLLNGLYLAYLNNAGKLDSLLESEGGNAGKLDSLLESEGGNI